MINNRFNVVYHLLYLVEKSFYKKKNKNMENKIDWGKLGPHYKRKFIIPVGRRKRWWEFWKKDESKKAIEELMSKYKQELILGEDGDIFIPSNDSK